MIASPAFAIPAAKIAKDANRRGAKPACTSKPIATTHRKSDTRYPYPPVAAAPTPPPPTRTLNCRPKPNRKLSALCHSGGAACWGPTRSELSMRPFVVEVNFTHSASLQIRAKYGVYIICCVGFARLSCAMRRISPLILFLITFFAATTHAVSPSGQFQDRLLQLQRSGGCRELPQFGVGTHTRDAIPMMLTSG